MDGDRYHEHRVDVSPRHGFIQTLRVDHHRADEGDDIGHCGLCWQMIWIDARIRLHQAMRPQVPVLCCICGPMSRDALMQALPGLELPGHEVPDLSHLLN